MEKYSAKQFLDLFSQKVNLAKYIKNKNKGKEHNFELMKHELLFGDINVEQNQAAIILFKKKSDLDDNSKNLHKHDNSSSISPISKSEISKEKNYYFCEEDGHVFPIIEEMPCLTAESAIIASKIKSFI